LYNRLGVAFRAKNDLPESSACFHRALAQPTISVRSATLAHLELGKTLGLMGQRDDAIAEYRMAAAAPDFAGSRQEAQKLLNSYVR
jgi:tetratricopeptide (TPR) repeat protein